MAETAAQRNAAADAARAKKKRDDAMAEFERLRDEGERKQQAEPVPSSKGTMLAKNDAAPAAPAAAEPAFKQSLRQRAPTGNYADGGKVSRASGGKCFPKKGC